MQNQTSNTSTVRHNSMSQVMFLPTAMSPLRLLYRNRLNLAMNTHTYLLPPRIFAGWSKRTEEQNMCEKSGKKWYKMKRNEVTNKVNTKRKFRYGNVSSVADLTDRNLHFSIFLCAWFGFSSNFLHMYICIRVCIWSRLYRYVMLLFHFASTWIKGTWNIAISVEFDFFSSTSTLYLNI